ncbi:hypothetical protein B0T24DRAFT_178255 [Lasiosphaeria ovina]|uniref:Uncharacterized protein n=1 Tax=Lasiosphaeria ovina TaxID=92902 RepID=A0AAE0NEH2_9PEZI|nr:hypothetical protein B0T24DRAFT_178255 [Lasiosphaeria ovina]
MRPTGKKAVVGAGSIGIGVGAGVEAGAGVGVGVGVAGLALALAKTLVELGCPGWRGPDEARESSRLCTGACISPPLFNTMMPVGRGDRTLFATSCDSEWQTRTMPCPGRLAIGSTSPFFRDPPACLAKEIDSERPVGADVSLPALAIQGRARRNSTTQGGPFQISWQIPSALPAVPTDWRGGIRGTLA